MNTLEKAMSQEKLTRDTVDAQFCSDWLKGQIKGLFDRVQELEKALGKIAEIDSADPKTGPDLEWHRRWRHSAKDLAQTALRGSEGK